MRRDWIRSLLLFAFFAASGTAVISESQAARYSLGSTGFDFSGDVSLTFKEFDKHSKINHNNRSDDPFNMYRVRLFIHKQWNPNLELNTELLWDNAAAARINGAYLIFSNLFTESLYAKVGLIPSPFGNYSHRSTYFNQNSVIGVPAMWQYHTPLLRNGSTTTADLFTVPRKRFDLGGVVPLYDACWDNGVSFHYEKGWFEGAAALTIGTLSNPKAYENDGYQGILRLGIRPMVGLRAGVSGAYGPWIQPDDSVVLPENLESYMQTALGGYLEYSFGHLEFWSEVVNLRWDVPFIEEGTIGLQSAYLESRWHLVPGWSLGGRIETLAYSKIQPDPSYGTEKTPWGYDFLRLEMNVGYRVIREGYIRLDHQATFFQSSEAEDVQITALQFQFAF